MEATSLSHKIFKKNENVKKKTNSIPKGICVRFKRRFADVVRNNSRKCDHGGNRRHVYQASFRLTKKRKKILRYHYRPVQVDVQSFLKVLLGLPFQRCCNVQNSSIVDNCP